MNTTLPGMLALLGVTELIIILMVLALPALALVTGIIVIVWTIRRNQKPPAAAPTTAPTPALSPTSSSAPSTSIAPANTAPASNCPQCGSPRITGSPYGLCPRCVLSAGFPTHGDAKAPATAPLPADLSSHFPQFEIREWIGRGGMGWVYLARQRQLDRPVALKILPPETARDPAFAERFLREAQALARLNHPNIVTIYDFGQSGPYFYFVMEYVEGSDLRQLERARPLRPDEALAIVPRICDALQYAHDEGVVHRDIKPENILIDRKGRVKIADFGIAKIMDQEPDITLTGRRAALGTPHYMAPEQIESPDQVDHRADLYALGVVFYEMLTGSLPLGRFESPSQRFTMDVRMDDIVLKSLERDPERRYQTASAVKTDIEAMGPTNSQPVDAATPESGAAPTRGTV